jgi:DNA repair/transcription protein MET18/MMS19
LIRGDPRALSLTENVFDLFSDETINWDAASSIGKIAAPTEVLTKTNYAVTKVGANYLDQLVGRNSSWAVA